MKRMLAALLSVILLSTLVVTASAAVVNPFNDVSKDAYYYEPVLWAVEHGITKGVTADTFQVNGTCNRGQVVTFLWRAAGCPKPTLEQMPFTDISASSFCYEAVLWSIEKKIVEVDSDTFGPTIPTSRGEFVHMLYLAEGSPTGAVYNPFLDVTLKNPCYKGIIWAYDAGVTNGVTATQFIPDRTCTRAQIVTFLWRYYTTKTEQQPVPDLPNWINAADYGLSPANDGLTNSQILQRLVDQMSVTGGTIHIPAGTYTFRELSRQSIGSHCVRMQSDVSITGDGNATILKPTGVSERGLDMFYYNDYVDLGSTEYLENCNFSDFVIDSSDTSCRIYSTAGKGFMFKLFRNCHWNRVTVKYTDGTGFGVDCPVNSSFTNCIAIGCGKGATTTSNGASGFGIGTGYAEDETLLIANCQSFGNMKFGFFFEHQGRFNNSYPANGATGFVVRNCYASRNYYNFGGVVANDTMFENCYSTDALRHGYMLENCSRCIVRNCTSVNEANTAFVILQHAQDKTTYPVCDNRYESCTASGSLYGVKVVSSGSDWDMGNNAIVDCNLGNPEIYAIYTAGDMDSLTITGNQATNEKLSLTATIRAFSHLNNSWNPEPGAFGDPQPPVPEMTEGGNITINGQQLNDSCWKINGVHHFGCGPSP